jgi:gliding motility-associated-like protein
MNRILLHKFVLTTILILIGGWSVVAQQYVIKGQSLNFRVSENPNYTYHWSVVDKSNGQVQKLSFTNHLASYTFNTAGTFDVKVYPEDKLTSCQGSPLVMAVIVNATLPTAVFDDLEVLYVCESNNGNHSNSKVDLTVRYTGPKPWTFKYSVNNAPAIQPSGAESINSDTFKFSIGLDNTTGKNETKRINLVEAQTVSGIAVQQDPEGQEVDVLVIPKPNTQFVDYSTVVQAGTLQTFTARIDKREEYQIFVPSGATYIIRGTTNFNTTQNTLTFDVQWGRALGNYQVKLLETNDLNCVSDTIYANVQVVESFTVSLGDTRTICSGESLTLTPDINFAGNYTYLWSDGSTEQSLIVTEAGNYTVTVTDTKTRKQVTASVQVNVNPIPVVNLGNDYQLSDGEVLTLDAGNTGSTYLWSTGETTKTIQVRTSGTYNVRVTNAQGCSASDEIIVTSINDIFVIELGPNKNICQGEEVVLDPKPNLNKNYTYLWNTGATTSTLTVSQSGTYVVTVRDTDDGYEKTDNITVTVHPLPIVDLGNTLTIYDGEVGTLDAGNAGTGATYQWSTGATTQTITVTQANVYSVQVTTVHGCRNSDQISVVTKPGHSFSVDLGDDRRICQGDQIFLEPTIDRTFNSDPTYSWIPTGATTAGITVNKSGVYCVNVTDPNGNTEQDCMTLTVSPRPNVDLGNDLTLQPGQKATLDAGNPGAFYRWSNEEITQSIEVAKAGQYWVEVISQQQCIGRDTVNVEYESDIFIGLPTAFTPNGDGKNDTFRVRGSNIASMSLIVLNRLGHKIFQSNRQDIGWDGTYKGQLQDIDVYVYVLNVTLTDGRTIQRQGNVSLLY